MTMATKPAQNFLIFLVGGSLFAAGVFLFTNQVMVSSGLAGFGWSGRGGGSMTPFFGGLFPFGTGQGFGLLMLPFGLGVALLFADSRRRAEAEEERQGLQELRQELEELKAKLNRR